MAGQPKKQKLIAELERRTRELFDEEDPNATHLDYVADWQARGYTLNSLAGEILGADDNDNGEFISRYLKKTFGHDLTIARLSRARASGGHSLLEQAMQLAEDTPADKDEIALAALQIRTKQFTAEKWNRDELGSQKGTTVNVNIGSLHLDSMRRRQLQGDPTIVPAIEGQAELVSEEIVQG